MATFLKRLFSRDKEQEGTSDEGDALHFYVQCDRCGGQVHLRVHKQYELNHADEGFVWHKTIVDSRCFRPMPTVVYLDRQYNVVQAEIEGGRYVTAEEYKAGN